MKADSEAAFQRQVVNLAEFYGWLIYHTHNSQRSAPGFPDLTLARGPELIFAELKGAKTTRRAKVAQVMARPTWLQHADVTDTQAQWLTALRDVSISIDQRVGGAADEVHACVDAYVWRPADFDAVNARLARGRHQLQPLYRPGALTTHQ